MGRASKDKRDIYYRKAKEEGYRARSAYKLLQIHEDYNILAPAAVQHGAVDLCAAPGSWSQVLSHILSSPPSTSTSALHHHHPDDASGDTKNNLGDGAEMGYVPPPVIAVDLQEMAPIPRVTILQGDITSTATAQHILDLLAAANARRRAVLQQQQQQHNGSSNTVHNGEGEDLYDNKASIVVCDGAPDVTGMHELDEYLQHQLLLAALLITTCVLRPGGTFVTKMFRGPNTPFLVHKSELFFEQVRVVKPKSSRNASVESFLLCQRFRLPGGYVPRLHLSLPPHLPGPHPDQNQNEEDQQEARGQNATGEMRETSGDAILLRVQGGSHIPSDADTFCLKQNMGKNANTAAVDALIVPFLSCGDLSGFDSDMCYVRTPHDSSGSAHSQRHVLPPVQPPLQAPYLPPTQNEEAETIISNHSANNNHINTNEKNNSPKESPIKKMKQ